MEDHQYTFSDQNTTVSDLVNDIVTVKKEYPFEHLEDISTNSAVCDMILKSEEDFNGDIKTEIIENGPNPNNLKINMQEVATALCGDSTAGMKYPQHNLIEKLVKKEEHPSSTDGHNEVGIHFEHIKIEKIEPSGRELLFSCEVCKKVFVNETDLIGHKSGNIDCIALEVDENEWNQEDKLTQGEDLKTSLLLGPATDSTEPLLHNKESHADVDKERLFCCAHCSKSFSRKSVLAVHQRVHREERPFQCKVCSRAFKRNGDLLKHARLHEGVKPYQCESCSESFALKEYLRKHEKKHADERFQCKTCPKQFLSKSDLTYHGRIHVEKRPFPCKICPKAFTRNFQLLEHEKLHAGVKPFHCRVCSKNFALKAYLHVHLKTHAPKIYQCDSCSVSFTKNKALLSHKKSSHNRLLQHNVIFQN